MDSVPVIICFTALDILKNVHHTLTLLLEYSVYFKPFNVQCKKNKQTIYLSFSFRQWEIILFQTENCIVVY